MGTYSARDLSYISSTGRKLNHEQRVNLHEKILEKTRADFQLPQQKITSLELIEMIKQASFCDLPPICDNHGFTKHRELIDQLSEFQSSDPFGKVIVKTKDLIRFDAFTDLLFDEKVIRIAAEYLGVIPSIQYCVAWKSPYAQPTVACRLHPDRSWHTDLHGHAFLKYFVYLSDVSLHSGPHELLVGTHRLHYETFNHAALKDTLGIKRVLGKIEAAETYKDKSVFLSDHDIGELQCLRHVFVGKAGTRFLENTRAIHRSTPLIDSSTNRYIFSVLFTPYDSQTDELEQVPIRMDLIESKLQGLSVKELEKLLSLNFKLLG